MLDDTSMTEQVLVALRRIVRGIDLHSKKLTQSCGLTGPQLMVLKEIDKYQEIPTGTLAKNINISQPTVTSILDRLEKKQLVVRKRNTHDKRKVFVKITDLGKITLNNAPSLLQDDFTHQFKQLETWEQTLILSTLQRIGKMMNQTETIHAAPILTSGIDIQPE